MSPSQGEGSREAALGLSVAGSSISCSFDLSDLNLSTQTHSDRVLTLALTSGHRPRTGAAVSSAVPLLCRTPRGPLTSFGPRVTCLWLSETHTAPEWSWWRLRPHSSGSFFPCKRVVEKKQGSGGPAVAAIHLLSLCLSPSLFPLFYKKSHGHNYKIKK